MYSLASVEEAVRGGQVDDARRELFRLNRKGKWGKCDPVHLGNLLWRTGAAARGLRLLASVLVETSEKNLCAKPEAAAEYAACLIRVGAFLEADWILGLREVAAVPMASLYQGLSRVTQWDYQRAVPAFEKFVETDGVSEYQRRVGYTNLAAALVYERRHVHATPILRRLMHDSQLNQNALMAGFVLEVASADRVLSGDYRDARRFLDESGRRFAKADTYHTALVEKWNALLDLAEKKDARAVEQMCRRAEQLEEWETVRDLEKYLALWTRNEALFHKVYFGTPFPAYRERLQRAFGAQSIPERYAMVLGGGGAGAKEMRFLIDAQEREDGELTSQNFALASLLASDFYRPHRLATLYGWLYPEQHFHPDRLGKRMNQAISRLNEWAKKQRLPLVATHVQTTYRLEASSPAVLWVPRPSDANLAWQPLIHRIERHFGFTPFSTSEAMTAFDRPRSSMVRQLQSLVASGQLSVTGKGPSSRYQLRASAKAA